MCRHLAYVGAPVTLHDLLFKAPHSLSEQSHHPRHQISGRTNPDGWGVAWYGAGSQAPVHYRTVTPIWDDEEFAQQARTIECTAVLAAARLASPGAMIDVTGNAPFVSGRWAFSLNGIVYGFTDAVGDQLRARLSDVRCAALEGDSDTEVLFGMVLDRLDAGDAPEDALASVASYVLAITTGRLNLLLTDGRAVYATRYGNSLFGLGSVLASEPLDDQEAWAELPDESLFVQDAHHGWLSSPLKGRA